MVNSQSKPIKIPIPQHSMDLKYPNTSEWLTYKTYLYLQNNLYPIPPLVFVASTIGIGTYLGRNWPDIFNDKLTVCQENGLLNATKLGLFASLVTTGSVYGIRKVLKYTFFSYKGFLFENPKKPSLKTKIWSCMRYVLQLNKPLFNSCDSLLPNLPVPPLDQSVYNYLESIKEIVGEEEFENVKKMAIDFLEKDGKKLQNYCKLTALTSDNYVSLFWVKYCYLFSREPLLINSSVGYLDCCKNVGSNQARRAAHVIYLDGMSMLAIDQQKLKPLGEGMMCMNHYKKNYCVNRTPGETMDEIVEFGIKKHVIIMHKGCIYKVDVFDDYGKVHDIETIYEQLVDILLQDNKLSEGESKIAALTTDRRDSWYRNRKQFMLSNELNRKNLDIIESAISVLYLCDRDDLTLDEESAEKFLYENLTGNGVNRWVDKSVNYSVTKSGVFGGTTEHSIADGIEFDHLMEDYLAIDKYHMPYPKEIEDIYQRPEKRGKMQVERLKFDVNEDLSKEILRCYDNHQEYAADVDLACIMWSQFGKGIIKKGKISPDGFVQMAIQLTYFKENNKFVLTYEAASPRFYQNARTETLRTVTSDSCNFVRGMLKEQLSKAEKYELLKTATEKHTANNKQCMVGNGFDRHLFVLTVLSKGLNIENEFLNYYIGQKWTLSTSQPPTVTNQLDEENDPDVSWRGAAFGAVDKAGYGVCYRFAANDRFYAYITSYKSASNTDSQRFKRLFLESINEMIQILDL
uniref:Carn_acyltransf domain-containing protein n=2 Tax=Rhabditophanes sp. KR3021 TaxID=114890 RepID=A0AC35U0F6_9BILA